MKGILPEMIHMALRFGTSWPSRSEDLAEGSRILAVYKLLLLHYLGPGDNSKFNSNVAIIA